MSFYAAKDHLLSDDRSPLASETKKGRRKQFVSPLFIIYPFLFGFCHIPFDIQPGHFRNAIGTYGDALLEMTGKFAFSVIGDFQLSLLTWLDGCLRICGHRAATTGNSLIDDQGGTSYIGEGKGCFLNGIALTERAEIVHKLVKLDFCLLLL